MFRKLCTQNRRFWRVHGVRSVMRTPDWQVTSTVNCFMKSFSLWNMVYPCLKFLQAVSCQTDMQSIPSDFLGRPDYLRWSLQPSDSFPCLGSHHMFPHLFFMPLDFLCRQFENTVDFPCFQTQSIGLILIWLNKNPVVSSVFYAVSSLQNAKIWIDNIIFYTLKFLDYADCL